MVRQGLHLLLLAALQKRPWAPAWGRAGHSPILGLVRGTGCALRERPGNGEGVGQAEGMFGGRRSRLSWRSCLRLGRVLPLQGGKGKCPYIPLADLPSPGTVIQQKPQPAQMDAEEGKGGLGAITCVVLCLSIARLSFPQIHGSLLLPAPAGSRAPHSHHPPRPTAHLSRSSEGPLPHCHGSCWMTQRM